MNACDGWLFAIEDRGKLTELEILVTGSFESTSLLVRLNYALPLVIWVPDVGQWADGDD